MDDGLEKYIRQNREEFDHRTPSKNVWSSIKMRMGLGSNTPTIWWKVAAIVFFALSVFLFLDRTPVIVTEPVTVAEDFGEVESYYLNVINEKKTLITDMTDQPMLGEEAERDLQRLDAMYEVLKEEYCSNPSKQVVDAIILNLLVRIDILNDEIQVVEESVSPEISI